MSSIKQLAIEALQRGDFDFALQDVARGEADVSRLVEDLKIYHAELEIQNEELRQNQIITENAMRRFSSLFAALPVPALVIDEVVVIHECNAIAEQRFALSRKQLRSHYFPRLLPKKEHGRLRELLQRARSEGSARVTGIELKTADEQQFIADMHLSLLSELAENYAQHFVVLIVDQTAAVKQQVLLEESHRHFQAYFDSAPVGMAAISADKQWLEVNDKLCDLFGYSRDALIKLTWMDLTHPGDLDAELVQFNDILTGKHEGYTLDKRCIRSDGEIIDVHVIKQGVRNAIGQLDYIVVIIEDVSVRKQAELALLERDQALENLSLSLRERIKELKAIYAISRASQLISDQDAFFADVLKLLPMGMNYTDDVSVSINLPSKTYSNDTFSATMDKLESDIQVDAQVVGKISVGYRNPHILPNNKPFLDDEKQFIEGIAELIGLFLTRIRSEQVQDLTSQRNAALLSLTRQATKMDEQSLLRFALEHAEALTDSHLAYVHFVNSDQNTISLGVWSGKTLQNCAAVHDNHYPLANAGVWADCFRLRRPVIHNDYPALDNKKGLPEGHATLLRHVSVPVIEDDNVVMIMGVGNKQDSYDAGDLAILEMLANNAWALVQRNRQQRKLELDAMVFRYSREAVVVTDGEQRILSVNPAFTLITGYTETEVLGLTPRLLKSGKHDDSFYQQMWAKLNLEDYWQGEIWNRRKNGEIYPQWLGISAARTTPEGRPSEYIAVFMDITEHQQAREYIEFLAHHDPLTSLPNRTLLKDRFQQTVSYVQRQGKKLGLLYLDLDHFKNVNDSLGHPIGDKLLLEVACRLRDCVREADTVSRLGGDEFVVLLGNVHHVDNLADISTKILTALLRPFDIEGNKLQLSCSIGACLYPDDGEEFDGLLQKADTALYQAKFNGRNTYKFYTESMNVAVMRRMSLENAMRLSLEREDFFVVYQPQFDIKSGQIVGAEALARWHHAELGIISPAEFIPVAEECGLIVTLGQSVLRQACRQMQQWLLQGHYLRVSVNVSCVQFLRHNLLQTVIEILEETGLPPHHLELELTESILVTDPEYVLQVVNTLNQRGVQFSIDDFGTGYSSLSYLKRFAVDKLKIDQSFVRDIPGDADDEVLVEAIVNLAHNLRLKCIAEGVETQVQADFLRQLGCDQIQGYLLGRPLSVDAMQQLLSSQSR
ncbi:MULTISPECIES: bifunctional diguanylate cyclase/phosphodiesterase [Methylotuvimicrobium]|uniref:cyclic-guanylate-specific phosphodiesterase n=2 Tax=Methylotuvimicrobium TaxID=2822410 RepID=G4SVS2_META2|nr:MULTISPECIES: EAL domain-containing protein [Methylotuvimicrobium]CCE24131.1 putative Diguanylate cyclase [Methylotuvimicrobium alcaliphilum 20Z]